MRRVLLATLALCFSICSLAQGPSMSPALTEWKHQVEKNATNERVEVVLVARQQPDLDSLDAFLSDNRVDRKERGRYVVNYLIDFAESHQNQWVKSYQFKRDVTLTRVFWVGAFYTAQVTRKGLDLLAKDRALAHMELTSEQKAVGHFPIPYAGGGKRAIGGIEPGLEAVQSRFLWDLGYTGKGQKILNLDTGIWPDHPSMKGRFVGQRAPLDQAWYPFDLFVPGDKDNSHGTHTNGTSIGLDSANQDTIGMAFNSYFMATDPIVRDVADVRDVVELMKGFQWALNPDGDPNTTHDMPDVINNSWGRPYVVGDTAMCGTFVDNTLHALEVAGIMSFQSAGNSGPGTGTVGFPAGNNPTLTSNFAVGAINAAVPSWPIASFSSRGPSVCGDTGSLLIKPEVVAPGVGVRSAVRLADGNYGYDSYQGTSMAAPHVSGIALLLAEAFPTASAQDIKMALYHTAFDLGDIGEDNTYGNGMIQAEEAYNFLSLSHTPMVPTTTGFDVNLTGTSVTNTGFLCPDQSVDQLYITATNVWNTTGTTLRYGIWEGQSVTHTWSGSMVQASDSIPLSNANLPGGGWVDFYAKLDQSNLDDDTLNNAWFDRLYVLHEETIPSVSEWSEDGWLEEMNWYVDRGDDIITWDTAHVFTLSGDNQCVRIPMFFYAPRDGQHDALVSPKYEWSASDADSLYLSFDYASRFRFIGLADSLKISVSTDCGENWELVKVYNVEDLNTSDKPLVSNTPFSPVDASDWKSDTISLATYRANESIIIKMESVNGGGNDLFIDRVAVFDEATPVSIEDVVVEESNWEVYPNPAQEQITISYTGEIKDRLTVQVIDVRGTVVMESFVVSNQKILNIAALPAGYYVVSIDGKSTALVVE